MNERRLTPVDLYMMLEDLKHLREASDRVLLHIVESPLRGEQDDLRALLKPKDFGGGDGITDLLGKLQDVSTTLLKAKDEFEFEEFMLRPEDNNEYS